MPSYQDVTVTFEDGEVGVFHNVVDINHWESALVELCWDNGQSKILRNFKAIDLSPPHDGMGHPITTIREVSDATPVEHLL